MRRPAWHARAFAASITQRHRPAYVTQNLLIPLTHSRTHTHTNTHTRIRLRTFIQTHAHRTHKTNTRTQFRLTHGPIAFSSRGRGWLSCVVRDFHSTITTAMFCAWAFVRLCGDGDALGARCTCACEPTNKPCMLKLSRRATRCERRP